LGSDADLPVVCTENSIRVDHVSESPNVGDDDRAVPPLRGTVRVANLGKKQKFPLSRESLRIVSGGGSDENTDGRSGRSRFPSGSGESQLAQRAANRSVADLQDVRRHLSSGH
jgi:hypothetical protein